MKNKELYNSLNQEAQFIYNLIDQYHSYFSSKDKKYRRIVYILKIAILLCAMASTIVLGLKDLIDSNVQITVGLILSALFTLLTAITAYFNFEEYWMRNITIHIQLNIIRDNFEFDAASNNLTPDKIENYRNELEDIQKRNIDYWKKAIKRI